MAIKLKKQTPAAITSPDSSHVAFFIDLDGLPKLKDSAGSVTDAAQAGQVTLVEVGTAPPAEPNKVKLYSKDVGGSSELFARGDSGDEVQVTSGNALALPVLASGTYTPTVTPGVNTAAVVASQCQWMRVGFVVTVSGKVNTTAVGPIVSTKFTMSLPVASFFTQNQQCAGAGTLFSSTIAVVSADTVANEASFEWYPTILAPVDFFFTFTYLIN